MPAGAQNQKANKIRKIRQDELRAKLAAQGHLQHVIKIAEELRDNRGEMDDSVIKSKKHAADIHLKLINKYLPDLKQVEQQVSHSVGEGVSFNMVFTADESN
jgi:hypothetical protein